MSAATPFDFAPLLPAGLPAPAARWSGLAKYSFVGGNNDPDGVPVDELVEAVTAVLKRLAYFDTSGKMVESYLKAPIGLKPFATVEVFIATTDVRGGTGANFVVDWAAAGEIAEPAVEALMVGGVGAGHYAFITQGRPIRPAGKN